MTIKNQLQKFNNTLKNTKVTLIAVSKTKPIDDIKTAYDLGQRHFGENKVQELIEKTAACPPDIQWHMIGHLQRNKVKVILPHTALIHSVDSPRLLLEIEKQAQKLTIKAACLLQIHIAKEQSKFGFSYEEVERLVEEKFFKNFNHVKIKGLMGMATLTTDRNQIADEFSQLNQFFKTLQQKNNCLEMNHLSMGMSNDYDLAIQNGATMIRVGSQIFGHR